MIDYLIAKFDGVKWVRQRHKNEIDFSFFLLGTYHTRLCSRLDF